MEVEKLYDKLLQWLLAYGPRIVLSLVILLAGQWILRLFKKWFNNMIQRRRLDPSLRSFIYSLVVTLLQVLLIMGVMQVMGIQMTMFAALVGGVGVAVGLALSGTLQNFTSGILILLLKPYRVHDNIIAQNQEGTVTGIQIFNTVVTTFDNKTVIIPNSKLSNEVIVNLSRQGSRRLDIEMKFSYAYDFQQIKASLMKSIGENADLLKEPTARIGIASLEPDGYKIAVNVWVNAHGFVDKRFAFHEHLLAGLQRDNIKLPGT